MTSIDCKENETGTKKHTILPFSSVTKMQTRLKKKLTKFNITSILVDIQQKKNELCHHLIVINLSISIEKSSKLLCS
jgi:hypothetical protein